MRIRPTFLLALALVATIGAAWPAEAAASGASVLVNRGRTDKPWVALTFDDGWTLEACTSIANILRAEHANGTFLVTGGHIASAPKQWKEALAGFPVANHSFSHPDFTKIRPVKVRWQIAHNEAVIEEALGRPMVKVLRPPFGAQNRTVLRIAGRLGYTRTVTWTMSAADTSAYSTVSTVYRNSVGGGPGAIILMHCGPPETIAALPSIIRSYKARGFRLVGLGQILGVGK